MCHASIHRAARCQSSFSSSPGSPACSCCLPSKGSRTGDRRLSSRKGSFTPEHGLAIPSRGAILPRLWARSRGLHSERCLSSITADGRSVLRRAPGGLARHRGDAAAPQLTRLSAFEAPLSSLRRAHLNLQHTHGFLSFFFLSFFLPSPPLPKCENNPGRITSRVLEKLSIFSGIEQKLKSWQLVKSCGQSRASCLAVCQNQTKERYKRVLPVREPSWNLCFCMRELEMGKFSFFYFKGAITVSLDYMFGHQKAGRKSLHVKVTFFIWTNGTHSIDTHA